MLEHTPESPPLVSQVNLQKEPSICSTQFADCVHAHMWSRRRCTCAKTLGTQISARKALTLCCCDISSEGRNHEILVKGRGGRDGSGAHEENALEARKHGTGHRGCEDSRETLTGEEKRSETQKETVCARVCVLARIRR